MRLEQDFVMRAVQQLAEFLARVLRLARHGHVDEARRELLDASSRQLGFELDALCFVDAETARALLGSAAKVRTAIELLETAARVEKLAGNHEKAAALKVVATELTG